MKEGCLDTILGHVEKGRLVMLRPQKNVVKVKSGPLGVFTRRYYLDLETFNELRKRLRYIC